MTKLINIAVNSCRECNYLRSNIGTGYTCLKLEDSKEFEPEFDFIKIHERCTLPDGTITIESMVEQLNRSAKYTARVRELLKDDKIKEAKMLVGIHNG